MTDRSTKLLLLASVFVIATCGLIYELIAGTLASYLLGDSVTQFSLVIGIYLSAMGAGSYWSKFVTRAEGRLFVRIQLLIGLLGGWSAAVLFVLFPRVGSLQLPLFCLIGAIGVLVGLEIPLLLRMLKGRLEFKDLVARVFAFDYAGALVASLLFPLLLVPHLGLVRSSLLFGMLNILVGLGTLRVLPDLGGAVKGIILSGLLILASELVGFVGADRLLAWAEKATYVDTVVFAKSSRYQRIVITRSGSDLRLHLNGNLQFSSRDEYRYHEALVHPGLSRLPEARDILVLGGGDGLAVREALRYPQVRSVALVDLDPEMTKLFSSQAMLTNLNRGSLSNPKVRVANADAFSWLAANTNQFDFVIADFPDPSTFSIGKLYTTAFYARLRTALAPGAAVVIQCTSPYVARKSFWCIDETLRASGFTTEPYHLYVPSFGEWGYILASLDPIPPRLKLPDGLKYITEADCREMFRFPPDMDRVPAEVNRLNNQTLVRYFEEEWLHYVH